MYVINTLTSTSTTDALSAYQGNLLNAAVLLKANDADLKAVAKSGDYNDLLNRPTIPAAQIQSDWEQTSTSALDFIKNKPTIPVVTSTYDATSNDGMSGVAVASGISSAIASKANTSDLYEWTAAQSLASGDTSKTFTGLNASYGYKAFIQVADGEDPPTGKMVCTGTSATVTFDSAITAAQAAGGVAYIKLRIFK